MHSDNGVNSFPLTRRRGEVKQEKAGSMGDRKFAGGHEQRVGPQRNTSSSSSSRNGESETTSVQAEMAELLKSCGVKFYGPLAKRYSPALIRAKVDEWRIDPSLGPGMLVRLIQGGGPVVGDVQPVERPSSSGEQESREWLEERYGRAREATDD